MNKHLEFVPERIDWGLLNAESPSFFRRIYWAVRCLPLLGFERGLFSLLVYPFHIVLFIYEMMNKMKTVLHFDEFTCILCFKARKDIRTESIIEIMKDYKKRIKQINGFFGLERFHHVILITDGIPWDGTFWGMASPWGQGCVVSIYTFNSMIYPCWFSSKHNACYILLHEYAHLIFPKVISKATRVFIAYFAPEWLREGFADGVALLFGHAEYIQAILSVDFQMRIRYGIKFDKNFIIQKRLIVGAYFADLIEHRKEFFIENLLQKEITFLLRDRIFRFYIQIKPTEEVAEYCKEEFIVRVEFSVKSSQRGG